MMTNNLPFPLRVHIYDDSYIELSTLQDGIKWERSCASYEDLPEEVKEKLGVLVMLSPDPPTTYVEGVGRRMSKKVYWLEDNNGENTGSESERESDKNPESNGGLLFLPGNRWIRKIWRSRYNWML